MPPRRGRGGRTATGAQPRVRAESPVASTESLQTEHPVMSGVNVAQSGASQANDITAEMAMFEEFRRFREFMRREPVVGGAPEGIAPQYDTPDVRDQPQHPPPPPPMQVHVQGPSYWEAMRNLKDMGMEFFSGRSNPTTADNWRKMLERNLDNSRCPQEYRRDLAVQYLKDEALIWWEKVVAQVQGRYELTWEDFKTEFSRKYFPREAMDRLENEFTELRQGNRTVREYEAEFDRLSRFAGRFMGEDELIRRFLRGLRIELKNRCEMYDYRNMIGLVEKAANLEIGLEKEMSQAKATLVKVTKPTNSHKRTWDTTNVRAPPICYRCHQTGHLQKDCPRYVTGMKCYECGQQGHIARFCPLKTGKQQAGERPKDYMPPPPKRQNVGPRVMMAGEHEEVEPIAGM